MNGSAGKDYITYNPMKSYTHSSGRIPCLQRLTMGRWKEMLVVCIILILSVVIYTGSACSSNLVKQRVITEAGVESGGESDVKSGVKSGVKPDVKSGVESEKFIKEELVTNTPDKESSLQRLPHFIIIGVKKAGTRALINFLRMHPDIETANTEVHFFDDEDTYGKGMQWYRKQMPYSYSNQLTGEKSPSYYRVKNVPERIHRMNESIKLILVVREPIDRCMSNYLQSSTKQDNFPSFEESVLLDREVNPDSPYIKNSNYNLFIDNWLKLFPLDQLRVVDGNLLITDPHLVLKELQDYLGIRQYIDEKFFKFDKEKGFYCYYNHSESLKCLGESKGRKHPAIRPELRLKLFKYFEPYNKLFFDKIGKVFDWRMNE